MKTQRKLSSLYVNYKRSMKMSVNYSKQAQQLILEYYTDDIIKSFKKWDDLLSNINFICYEDLGVGKLIAISIIKEKYEKLRPIIL